MKKTLSIILLLCLCFGVVSCTPEEKSYISEISDIAFDCDAYFDNEAWFFSSYLKLEPKTIELKGVEYMGEYEETEANDDYGGNIKRDYYYVGDGVSFAVESGTDRIVYFRQAFLDLKTESVRGETSKLTIAQDIAKQYLGDLFLYDLKSETLYVSENGVDYGTKYTYTKRVQGYSTTDFLCVSVTNSGKIEKLSIGQTGAFDSIEKINTEKIEESISNVLAENFEKDGTVITEKLSCGKRIVLLESGEVHLASCYYVWTKGADGAEKYEYVTVLTHLE